MSQSSQQSQPELCLNNYSPEYEYNYSPMTQLSSATINEHDNKNNSSQETQETDDELTPLTYRQCHVLLTRCEVDKAGDHLDQDTEVDVNRQIEELREEREEHLLSQNQPSPCMTQEQQAQEEVDDKEANKENISPMSYYSYYEFPDLPSPWP